MVNKIYNQAMELSFIEEDEVVELFRESGFIKFTPVYKAFIHAGWVIQKNN